MTPHEQYVAALMRERGYGVRDVADALGVGYNHYLMTPGELEAVRQMWEGGHTVEVIARATGRCENAVRYQIRRMGL